MSQESAQEAPSLRESLERALSTARAEQDEVATGALQSALHKIDSGDPGRVLTESDERRLVEAEVAAQLSAADQSPDADAERAAELRRHAEVLTKVLATIPRSDEVEAFWREAVRHTRYEGIPGYLPGSTLGVIPPPSWSFGGTGQQADELLELVLAGTKTATASALWDYEAEGEPLPAVGALGIVLDSAGHPRALLATTQVDVVPFDEVTAEHAAEEGEGDRSLAHWRTVHEQFFREYRSHDREFTSDMPVVCERFTVLYSG